MEKSDKELIVDYLNGDESALPVLINRYLKSIYNFAYRLTGNVQSAEDISQETFFKAWKNLKKYKPEESFKTWLFTIARNTTFDFLRKKKSFVFSDLGDEESSFEEDLVDDSPQAEEIISQLEDKKLLDDLLNKLSPIYKEIILLHHLNELTFEEIAKMLGKSVNTVKSQHRRALIELKKLADAPK